MKYKKSGFRRKKIYSKIYKKRNLMYKNRINRSMISGPMKPYLFKRNTVISTLNFGWKTTAQSVVYTPTIGDLPNMSEFTNLYDEYKLNKIILHFESLTTGRDMNQPAVTAGGLFSSASLVGSLKRIRVVRDYNDSTALATENSAFEYQNMRSYPVGKSFKIVLYPRLLGMNYRNAVSTSYTSIKPKYIDTNDLATPHYGLKFFVPALTGDTSDANINLQLYTCRATYLFSCRNVK